MIDDDIRARTIMEEIFENTEFTVECFRTGKEGIKRILSVLEQKVDIVLIDMRLPDTNGLNILQLIKEYNPKTCCIILTAYPTVEDAVKAIKLGAYEYIEKPLDPKLILNTIRKAIDEGVVPHRHPNSTKRKIRV